MKCLNDIVCYFVCRLFTGWRAASSMDKSFLHEKMFLSSSTWIVIFGQLCITPSFSKVCWNMWILLSVKTLRNDFQLYSYSPWKLPIYVAGLQKFPKANDFESLKIIFFTLKLNPSGLCGISTLECCTVAQIFLKLVLQFWKTHEPDNTLTYTKSLSLCPENLQFEWCF